MHTKRSVVTLIVSFLFSAPVFAGFQEGVNYFDAKKYDKAYAEFLPLANKGDKLAQFRLGVMYAKGYGVKQDGAAAIAWYQKAAAQGVPEAQYNIALSFAEGFGVKANAAEALRWYRKAASQQLPEAEFEVGAAYYHGNGTKVDKREAFRWLSKAAEHGEPMAQYSVGAMLEHGEVGRANKAEAIRWYRQAAENGYVDAQYFLGVRYLDGDGVAKNRAEGIRWLRLAAEQGHEDAVSDLRHEGVMPTSGPLKSDQQALITKALECKASPQEIASFNLQMDKGQIAMRELRAEEEAKEIPMMSSWIAESPMSAFGKQSKQISLQVRWVMYLEVFSKTPVDDANKLAKQFGYGEDSVTNDYARSVGKKDRRYVLATGKRTRVITGVEGAPYYLVGCEYNEDEVITAYRQAKQDA